MIEVDVSALDEAMAAGVPVIDVREADEFAQARIPGATLLPLSEFIARMDELPDVETLYLVCAVGARSLQAAQYLNARGINAVSVAGGTDAWLHSGRAVERG